jgi:hypothetical protein
MADYGALAFKYTRAFRSKWVGEGKSTAELLGASDIQSMADMMNTFSAVERTRLAPFGLRRVFVILGMTLAPMVPLVLSQVSLTDLIDQVARVFIS